MEVRLCIASLVSDSQCSLFLCFSRGLLQRTSQGAVLAMGQWVVERWPTVHSNRAPKMGAVRNWVLRGRCQACPSGFLSGSTLCYRTRGVLQAEGREGGLGHDVEVTGVKAGELEVAGGTNRTGYNDDQSNGVSEGSKPGCNKGDCRGGGSNTGESGGVGRDSSIGEGSWVECNSGGCKNASSSADGGSRLGGGSNKTGCSYGQGSGEGGGSKSGCDKGGCSSGCSSTRESDGVSRGSSIGGDGWAGCNRDCNTSSGTGRGSNIGGDNNRAGCTNGGGNGTRTGVVEELEEAGETWEATLLAALLQLCKLLALHTGGATGTWRQLRRRFYSKHTSMLSSGRVDMQMHIRNMK